jgi:hypothetical protein
MITKDENYLRQKTRVFIRSIHPNASRLKWGDNEKVTGYWFNIPGKKEKIFAPCKL